MTFTDLELAGLGARLKEELEYPQEGQTVVVYGHEFAVHALQYLNGQITVVLEYKGEFYLMNGWTNDAPDSWAEYGYRSCEWDGRLFPAEKKEVTSFVWAPVGGSDYSIDSDSWGSWG